MKKILIVLVAVGLMAGFMVPTGRVLATDSLYGDICGREDVANELKEQAGCFETKRLPKVMEGIINFVISLVGLIGVAVMIYAGFKIMTANGEAGAIAQAKKMMIYGVIGLVLSGLAFAIVNFVVKSLG